MRNVGAVVFGGVVAPSDVSHQSTPDGEIRRDSGLPRLAGSRLSLESAGSARMAEPLLLLLRYGNELHESDPRCPHRF
jgi:hypothetical protein